MVKASNLNSSVKFCLGGNAPLMLKYNASLAHESYLEFYLAPLQDTVSESVVSEITPDVGLMN